MDSAASRLSASRSRQQLARKRVACTSTASFLPIASDCEHVHDNLARVRAAAACAINAGARIVSLGGFSSILIEGNFDQLPETARHDLHDRQYADGCVSSFKASGKCARWRGGTSADRRF